MPEWLSLWTTSGAIYTCIVQINIEIIKKGSHFFATFRSQKAMSKQLDYVKTTYLIAASSVLLASGMESVGSNIGDNYKLQMSLNIIFQAYY